MDLRDQLKNLFPDHVEQDFQMPEEQHEQREPLICKYEKKGRNEKPVTLIEDFEGSEEELKNISKKIKITLGIGGSEKDGVIIIQGDNRDKIMKIQIYKGAKMSDTVTLTDNRNGKSYDFPILHGTMGLDVIDISTFFSDTRMFTFDHGYKIGRAHV